MKTPKSFRSYVLLKECLPLIASLILLSFQGCKLYSSINSILESDWESISQREHGVPRIEYQQDIPILHLYGDYGQMGVQYGILLKDHLNAEENIVRSLFSKKTINRYQTIARNTEKNLDRQTLEFIKGMSEGSDVDYLTLLALNTVPKTTCSVLAVWGEATPDNNLLMGRNADYKFKKINKALGLIVVKHFTEGNSSVSSSFLGLAGSFTGINEKGVCFGNMLVYNGQEDTNFTEGVPIQILMQNAANKCNSAREFIESLIKQKHSTPVNVMCADEKEAIIAELGQDSFAIREGSRGVLAASNYFYSSGMLSESVVDKRFASLMQSGKEHHGNFTLKHLEEAMYKARQKNKNLQCVLFDPSEMKIYVSMNKVPASKGPFKEFDIQELLEE